MDGKRILLIVGGGIAAFKSLELIRLISKAGGKVTPVLTGAGAQFVTPLSLSALSGEKVYTDLFDLTDEAEMGHIQLSRSADLIVVAPATADLMARMANGLAHDLATTLLLATDTPVLIAPAMNVRMWQHPATRRNLATLKSDGIAVVGPNDGVSMRRDQPFVGQHTPAITPPGGNVSAGIAQGELALQKGRQYVGRMWLQAADQVGADQVGPIRVG